MWGDERLDFIVNDLGYDAGLDYKKENIKEALKRLVPEDLDIYFDNVGGETLDAALDAMKDYGCKSKHLA